MGKAKTVVKFCEVHCLKGNETYETKDVRYNVKYPIIKVIKKCLKLDFSFKVGFRENTLIGNMNYIEITSDWFLHTKHSERERKFEETKQLMTWMKKGEK